MNEYNQIIVQNQIQERDLAKKEENQFKKQEGDIWMQI